MAVLIVIRQLLRLLRSLIRRINRPNSATNESHALVPTGDVDLEVPMEEDVPLLGPQRLDLAYGSLRASYSWIEQ